MPEDSLTLFLIDPSRGDLIVCNRMLKDDVIQSPREFRNLNRRRYAGGGAQETRCEPLCAPGWDTPIPAPEADPKGV